MGASLGFGITNSLVWDVSLEDALNCLSEFSQCDLCGEFIEIITDHHKSTKPDQRDCMTAWKVIYQGPSELPQRIPIAVSDELYAHWITGHASLSYDDWTMLDSVGLIIPGIVAGSPISLSLKSFSQPVKAYGVSDAIRIFNRLLIQADKDDKWYYESMIESFETAEKQKFLICIC